MSIRPQLIPRCTACLQQYALGAFIKPATPIGPLVQQQLRGKKKMANNSATVTVRLLKDMPEFGRKGALVPAPRGQMRNQWFPRHIAEYVTAPELKHLRASGASVDRDYMFLAKRRNEENAGGQTLVQEQARPVIIRRKEPIVMKISPSRSLELFDVYVPKRLDFHRQVIAEENISDDTAFDGVAGDLFAASPVVRKHAIYGSVNTQDVLTNVRALMANDEEAARVVIDVEDIHFTDLSASENVETDKVKHTGDFHVEFRIKGAAKAGTRTVRVIAQES